MPSPIESTTGLYVSSSTADTSVAPSATYHLEVGGTTSVDNKQLAYDEIFDIELTTDADVVNLLKLMTVANVMLTEDAAAPDAATCTSVDDTLNGGAGLGVAVLDTILKTAAKGVNNAKDYLQYRLNQIVNGSLTGSVNYHGILTSGNINTYVPSDLSVNIDADSGVISIDNASYLAAAKSVATVALNNNDMVNEIPYATLAKYDDGQNGATITRLPVLLGDQIVFGVKVSDTAISLSPTATTFAAGDQGRPTGSFGTSPTTADVAGGADNFAVTPIVLAFRVTLTGSDPAKAAAKDIIPY